MDGFSHLYRWLSVYPSAAIGATNYVIFLGHSIINRRQRHARRRRDAIPDAVRRPKFKSNLYFEHTGWLDRINNIESSSRWLVPTHPPISLQSTPSLVVLVSCNLVVLQFCLATLSPYLFSGSVRSFSALFSDCSWSRKSKVNFARMQVNLVGRKTLFIMFYRVFINISVELRLGLPKIFSH